MGIEPTSEAWEASILPLYDARSSAFRLYISTQFFVQTGPFEDFCLVAGTAPRLLYPLPFFVTYLDKEPSIFDIAARSCPWQSLAVQGAGSGSDTQTVNAFRVSLLAVLVLSWLRSRAALLTCVLCGSRESGGRIRSTSQSRRITLNYLQ
jgi:hypothetical protein